MYTLHYTLYNVRLHVNINPGICSIRTRGTGLLQKNKTVRMKTSSYPKLFLLLRAAKYLLHVLRLNITYSAEKK